MSNRGLPAVTRFWSHVDKTDTCWLWTASVRGGFGYGAFSPTANKQVAAHRYSFELHVGPIPDGLNVLHKCDTPRCVRPDHLFLGTALDNMRDKMSKGRGVFHRKTHCKRGHEFTAANTYVNTQGGRVCWRCRRLAQTGREEQRITLRSQYAAEVQRLRGEGMTQMAVAKHLGISGTYVHKLTHLPRSR